MDSWIILICIVFVSRAWHFEPCPMGRCNLYFSFDRNLCVESYNPNLVVNTVKTHVKEHTFLEVWQKRFLYFGVVIGNLG